MKYYTFLKEYFLLNRRKKILTLSLFVTLGGVGMLLFNLNTSRTFYNESDINVVSGSSNGSNLLSGISGLNLGNSNGDFMELENLPLLIRSRLVFSDLLDKKIDGIRIFNLMCEAKGIGMYSLNSEDSVSLLLHERWIKDIQVTRLSKESALMRIRYESGNKSLADSLIKKLLPTVLTVYNKTSDAYNATVMNVINGHIDSVRQELIKIEDKLLDVKMKNDLTVSHADKSRLSKLEAEKMLLITLYGELIKSREMKFAIQKSKISEFQEINYFLESRIKKRSKKIDVLLGVFIGGFIYFFLFPLRVLISKSKII